MDMMETIMFGSDDAFDAQCLNPQMSTSADAQLSSIQEKYQQQQQVNPELSINLGSSEDVITDSTTPGHGKVDLPSCLGQPFEKVTEFSGWSRALDMLSKQGTFIHLMALCTDLALCMPEMPNTIYTERLDWDREDERTTALFNSVGVSWADFFLIATSANGSCLPHILS